MTIKLNNRVVQRLATAFARWGASKVRKVRATTKQHGVIFHSFFAEAGDWGVSKSVG